MSEIEELKKEIEILREQLRDQKELNEFHRKLNGDLNEELDKEKKKYADYVSRG